jgi:hypothetical protein
MRFSSPQLDTTNLFISVHVLSTTLASPLPCRLLVAMRFHYSSVPTTRRVPSSLPFFPTTRFLTGQIESVDCAWRFTPFDYSFPDDACLLTTRVGSVLDDYSTRFLSCLFDYACRFVSRDYPLSNPVIPHPTSRFHTSQFPPI